MADKWESIMTIVGLAEHLKMPKSTPCEQARGGRAPDQKVGRNWRFRRAVVDQWLAVTGEVPGSNPKTGSETSDFWR